MNIFKELVYWVEDHFVLTLRGLMAFFIVGLIGFMLGGFVSLYCLVSIIESVGSK